MRRFGKSIGSLLLVSTFFLSACGGVGKKTGGNDAAAANPGDAKSPIKIGVILSRTGSASWLGEDEHAAIELFVKAKNEKGGINGRQIDVTYFDDQSNPEQADRGAKQMVSSKVSVVVGPSITPTSYAVEAVIDRAKIPMISMSGGYVPKSASGWADTFSAAQQVQRIFADFKARNFQKIAVVTIQDSLGQIVQDAVKKAIPQLGLQLAGMETYQASDVNYQAQLTRINNGKPDAILIFATGDSVAVVYRQMRELGMNVPVAVASSSATQAFLDKIGNTPDGTLLAPASKVQFASQLPATDPNKKVVDDFVGQFQKAYSKAPTLTHSFGWDGISVAVAAIEKVGPDPALINKFLEQGNEKIVTATGTFSFSKENRTGISVDDLVFITNMGGQWRIDASKH